MIKVVYTYKTKTCHLDELMAKFAQSADEQFDSTPTNIKIELSRRDEGDDTYMRLDIYYQSMEDYLARKAQEESWEAWQAIWFNPNNRHEEVSVDIYHVLA